jgi:hypothetical protein
MRCHALIFVVLLATVPGYGQFNPSLFSADTNGTIRSTGQSVPAGMPGLEVEYNPWNSSGYIRAYDRTNSIFLDLYLNDTVHVGRSGSIATPGDITTTGTVSAGTLIGNLGPSSVQTSSIANGAVTADKLAADAIGSVQQVIRGVVTFTGTAAQVTQAFSPSIDPAKSYVIVGAPVFAGVPNDGFSYTYTRLGATLIDLTTNHVTLAIDEPPSTSYRAFPCRVSYQVIQFK